MSKATVIEEPATCPAITIEQRHALALRAWEAINTERELSSVLATVADVLVPVIAMESISVVIFDQSQPPPFAMHTVGLSSNENQKHEVRLREGQIPVADSTTAHKRIPYENSDMKVRHQAGLPYLCADLLKKES